MIHLPETSDRIVFFDYLSLIALRYGFFDNTQQCCGHKIVSVYQGREEIMIKGGWLLLSILATFVAKADSIEHQRQTLEFAERSIIIGLTRHTSSADAELGLIIVGEGNSQQSLQFLAQLMRWKIDAGLSETYSCYLLDKGKAILPFLESIRPAALRQKCSEDVSKMKAMQPSSVFFTLEPDQICASVENIAWRKSSTIDGVHNGALCEEDDW